MIQNLIIKVASVCNLRCSYCYSARNDSLQTDVPIMEQHTLETLIRRVAAQCSEKKLQHFIFSWHGGEPLLAGFDFFEHIVELQRELMPGVNISNSIQTNGMLLTRRWVDMFKSLGYHVSLSLDGPDTVHDAYRRTATGQGTHRKLVERIGILKDECYPIRILAVVTPESLSLGGETIYKYFRQLGCVWMDFLYPICNAIDNTFPEKLRPEDLAKFYIEVFDAWFSEGDPQVYVRSLHDWCLMLLRGRSQMCHSRTDCSYVVTVNTNGSIHICDDLMPYTDSHLGHIATDSLAAVERNEKLRRLSRRSVLFGDECVKCKFFPVCAGGCTLFRTKRINNFTEKNFFCTTQKLVISHVRDVIQAETKALFL